MNDIAPRLGNPFSQTDSLSLAKIGGLSPAYQVMSIQEKMQGLNLMRTPAAFCVSLIVPLFPICSVAQESELAFLFVGAQPDSHYWRLVESGAQRAIDESGEDWSIRSKYLVEVNDQEIRQQVLSLARSHPARALIIGGFVTEDALDVAVSVFGDHGGIFSLSPSDNENDHAAHIGADHLDLGQRVGHLIVGSVKPNEVCVAFLGMPGSPIWELAYSQRLQGLSGATTDHDIEIDIVYDQFNPEHGRNQLNDIIAFQQITCFIAFHMEYQYQYIHDALMSAGLQDQAVVVGFSENPTAARWLEDMASNELVGLATAQPDMIGYRAAQLAIRGDLNDYTSKIFIDSLIFDRSITSFDFCDLYPEYCMPLPPLYPEW